MKTQILLTIDHKKPISDLLDKVAGRAYTLAGVDDVTAELLPEQYCYPKVTGFIEWFEPAKSTPADFVITQKIGHFAFFE